MTLIVLTNEQVNALKEILKENLILKGVQEQLLNPPKILVQIGLEGWFVTDVSMRNMKGVNYPTLQTEYVPVIHTRKK